MQGNRGKTDKEHWYEHVPKSVETRGQGNHIMESASAN
jgi:hypothetical protein